MLLLYTDWLRAARIYLSSSTCSKKVRAE